ncbi:DUF1254 domain-containing protein [Nocardia sp. NPDC005978]|uniref:DUF1254 domain-containing protein n=1 Tax=Nocardia sp. NPDC005978 TaxID=3156725 RepID=UPI0033BAAD44
MDALIGRRSLLGLAAGLAAAALTGACGSSGEADEDAPPGADEALQIATDAYVFGYPLVLIHATRDAGGPVNAFRHSRALPTDEDRLMVRANQDTLYSNAWLDLSGEPMVLQVPAMEPDRYWIMQLLDAWTNTVHHPSAPRPGVAGTPALYTYLISGPGWDGTVPPGVTHLAVPTNTTWLLGRIQVNGAGDVPAVRALQDRMRLAPLPDWLADPQATRTGPAIVPSEQLTAPLADVAALDGRTFFDRLCTLMTIDAPAPADAPALRRFARIGIEPGGRVDDFPIATLDAAAAAARKRITAHIDPSTRTENGWLFSTALGAYGTDYLQRAAIAQRGLGANLPEDALYPSTPELSADVNGEPRMFRIRFEAGRFPPVAAFWSLTAYDAENFLVDNPDRIYAVGHGLPVVPAPDGSAEILIQHADPGPAVPRGNWLPIPATGMFSLTLRLYAPRPEAVDGRWQPPEIRAVS